MKKIAVLLILLVFISGCTWIYKLPFMPSPAQRGISINYGSSNAVDTTIAYPKSSGIVYEEYKKLSPVIRVTNSGDYKKPKGSICVSGLDKSIFGGFSGCDCQIFPQKTYEDVVFKSEDITFPSYTITLDKDQKEADFTITAITRFNYQTKGKVKLCLKKDIYGSSGCTIEVGSSKGVEKLMSTTSGPLKIKSVKQSLNPEPGNTFSIILTIVIEQQSKGRIIDKENINDLCVPQTKPKSLIYARVKNMPLVSMVCNPQKLDSTNQVTIICRGSGLSLFDGSGQYLLPNENYQPNVEVELNYAFETVDSNIFKVKKTI